MLDPKLKRLLADSYMALHSAEMVVRDPTMVSERDREFIADTIRLVEQGIIRYVAPEQVEEAQ